MGAVWIIKVFCFGSKAKGDILHYIEIIYYLDWFFTNNMQFLALNGVLNVQFPLNPASNLLFALH